MQITFQRYVVEDRELLEEHFKGIPLADAMRQQFEVELDAARAPRHTIVETRLCARKDPKNDWYEFVLDFPSYEGREIPEVVKEVQGFYDEGGLAGFFECGNTRHTC
jgi:hypothetical protein